MAEKGESLSTRMKAWVREGPLLRPTESYINNLNRWLSTRGDDAVFRFKFAPSFTAPDVRVHNSRLIWAGGPLLAMAEHGFLEKVSKQVSLSEGDDPDTFAVLRDFLYCMTIMLDGRSVRSLVKIACSAHRWELLELFEMVCEYLQWAQLLDGVDDVILVIDIARLPGIPDSFKVDFWDYLVRWFDKLMEVRSTWEGSTEKTGENRKPSGVTSAELVFCPAVFPDVWQLALSHNTVQHVIQGIMRYSTRREEVAIGLLNVTFDYLAPQIRNDHDIGSLLEELDLDIPNCKVALSNRMASKECPTSALRWFTNRLQDCNVATFRGDRMEFSWTSSLHDLMFRDGQSGKRFLFTPQLYYMVPTKSEYSQKFGFTSVRDKSILFKVLIRGEENLFLDCFEAFVRLDWDLGAMLRESKDNNRKIVVRLRARPDRHRTDSLNIAVLESGGVLDDGGEGSLTAYVGDWLNILPINLNNYILQMCHISFALEVKCVHK